MGRRAGSPCIRYMYAIVCSKLDIEKNIEIRNLFPISVFFLPVSCSSPSKFQFLKLYPSICDSWFAGTSQVGIRAWVRSGALLILSIVLVNPEEGCWLPSGATWRKSRSGLADLETKPRRHLPRRVCSPAR